MMKDISPEYIFVYLEIIFAECSCFHFDKTDGGDLDNVVSKIWLISERRYGFDKPSNITLSTNIHMVLP